MPFTPETIGIGRTPTGPTPGFKPEEEKAGGFFSNVWDKTKTSASKRFASVADTFKATAKGEINPLQTGLRTVGAAAGFVGDVAGAGLVEGVKAVTPDAAEESAKRAGIALLQTKPGQAGLRAISQGVEAYNQWKSENESAAKDLEATINIASLFPIERLASAGIKAGIGATKSGLKKAVRTAEVIGDLTTGEKTGIKFFDGAADTARPLTGAIGELVEEGSQAIQRGTGRISKTLEEKAAQAGLPAGERQATRAGIAPEILERVKTAGESTKRGFKKMIDVADKAMTDVRSRVRPIQVAGEDLVEQAKYLSTSLKQTGKELGTVKSSLKGQIADTTKVRQEVLNDMDDMGLRIDDAGRIVAEGPVENDLLELMTDIYNYAGKESEMDAINLDRLRMYLRSSYTKQGVPLQGRAQAIAEKYRELALETLNDFDSEYGRLAREYAEKYRAIEDFTKLIGYKGSMENITEKGLRAGEVASRVLGNASDRPQTVIDQLIESAKQAGYKGDVDVYDLIRFADELEDVLGQMQSRSLGGQVQRAGENIVNRAGGIMGQALESVARMGAPDAKEKLNALRQFIDELMPDSINKNVSPKGKGAVSPKTTLNGAFDGKIAGLDQRDIFNHGGVTIDIRGNRPTTGFVYSPLKENELRVPSNEFRANADEITRQYVLDHADTLAEDGKYLGVWMDDDSGDTFLDTVVVEMDEMKAVEGTLTTGDLGMYNIGTGKTHLMTDYEKIDGGYRYKGADTGGSIPESGGSGKSGPGAANIGEKREKLAGPTIRSNKLIY